MVSLQQAYLLVVSRLPVIHSSHSCKMFGESSVIPHKGDNLVPQSYDIYPTILTQPAGELTM